jgi:hypothetical protein
MSLSDQLLMEYVAPAHSLPFLSLRLLRGDLQSNLFFPVLLPIHAGQSRKLSSISHLAFSRCPDDCRWAKCMTPPEKGHEHVPIKPV